MAPFKVEFPFILAPIEGRGLSADTVVNVVIDFAIIDERSPEMILGIIPGTIILTGQDIGFTRDQMVYRKRPHHNRIEILDNIKWSTAAGINCTTPGRYPIINKIGEVGLRIIRIGNAKAQTGLISHRNAISNEAPMHLHRCRQLHGINIITGGNITILSVIQHGNRRPIGSIFILRIRQSRSCCILIRQRNRDITARIHHLIMQIHRGYSVRISHFGGHGDHLSTFRLLR